MSTEDVELGIKNEEVPEALATRRSFGLRRILLSHRGCAGNRTGAYLWCRQLLFVSLGFGANNRRRKQVSLCSVSMAGVDELVRRASLEALCGTTLTLGKNDMPQSFDQQSFNSILPSLGL